MHSKVIIIYKSYLILINRTTATVVFNKATMFKNKIEIKTKEEVNKEKDGWLAEITKKGIQYENFNALRRRLSSANDQQLHHGVEKNIDINKLPIAKQYLIITKNTVKDYLHKNFNVVVGTCLVVVLLYFLIRIYSLLLKIDRDNTDLNEKYSLLLNEMSINNQFQCKK